MKVLEVFKNKLRNRNYSDKTISIYVHYSEKFIINTKIKDPYQLSTKAMVEYLENFKYTSISQQNQIINGLKQFYRLVLNKSNIHLNKIERPRKHLVIK